MKNYCMNFVSIKNLATKALQNTKAIKGGKNSFIEEDAEFVDTYDEIANNPK